MAFLQINNPDGTSGVKRPFRLVDLQDVWNGIKSLFRALSGQDFRIISGFDLEDGVYTSGTVWYDGELYEYDKDTYPITPDTAIVSFGSVPQENRVWQGLTIRPFASRFICGGDGYSGTESFTKQEFVENIERFKSYLGDGSIATSKLADSSVTLSKLSGNAKSLQEPSGSESLTESSISIVSLFDSEFRLPLILISNSSPNIIELGITATPVSPLIILLEVLSSRSTVCSIDCVSTRGSRGTISIPAKLTSPDMPSSTFILFAKRGGEYIPISVYTAKYD